MCPLHVYLNINLQNKDLILLDIQSTYVKLDGPQYVLYQPLLEILVDMGIGKYGYLLILIKFWWSGTEGPYFMKIICHI